MMDFSSLLVGGIPLLLVIFGLVEFIKSFGLAGKWLTLCSLILGLVFGLAYQIANTGLPAGFAAWFATLTFGLTLGLVTSGFYKWSNDRFPRQV